MIVIGQLMEALKSGKYDPDKTALIMSQTGGGCRASNYIHLLRKALKENNLEQVPVISLNASGLEKHEGFKMYPGLLIKCIYALIMEICLCICIINVNLMRLIRVKQIGFR